MRCGGLTEEAQREGAMLETDAARELVDALGADMMLIASELEKLLLYRGASGSRITLGDVETMVLAAKQRSLYELTDAISSKDTAAGAGAAAWAAECDRWRGGCGDRACVYAGADVSADAGDSGEEGEGTQRAMWQVLWQGFRMPPFAAEDLITQARRYQDRGGS